MAKSLCPFGLGALEGTERLKMDVNYIAMGRLP
jgi:hypothetical protein